MRLHQPINFNGGFTMKEIYRDIKGYEGLYQVSNLGNVKSLNYNNTNKEKVLQLCAHEKGYLYVGLYKNGKRKSYIVHRLVAETFLNNPDNLPEINHKDENKTNNCVDNLEWCTTKYNINYGIHNEKMAKKLSKPINQYDLQGNFIKSWNSATEINKVLGFDNTNISKCCRDIYKTAYGYKWRYVNEEVA